MVRLMWKTASWFAVAGLIALSVAQKRPRPNAALLAEDGADAAISPARE
jgi:hypothetical protein